METILAIAVVFLAAGGLATGLFLAGRPPETSCGGLACSKGERCMACPRRAHSREPGGA